MLFFCHVFFFSSRRRHTRSLCDWSSDVCSSDLGRRRVALWTATLWLLIAISGNYRSRYMLVVSPGLALLAAEFLTAQLRSEERRVGKEGISRCKHHQSNKERITTNSSYHYHTDN